MTDRKAMDDMLAQAHEVAQGNQELLASMMDDIERMFRRQERLLRITDPGDAAISAGESVALSQEPFTMAFENPDTFVAYYDHDTKPMADTDTQQKGEGKGKGKEKEKATEPAEGPPASSRNPETYSARRAAVSAGPAHARPYVLDFDATDPTGFRVKVLLGQPVRVPGPAELQEYEDAATGGRVAAKVLDIRIDDKMTLEDFIDDQICQIPRLQRPKAPNEKRSCRDVLDGDGSSA